MTYYKTMTGGRRGPHTGERFDRNLLPPLSGKPREWGNGWHACQRHAVLNNINVRIAEVQAESWTDFGDGVVATCGEVAIIREGRINLVGFYRRNAVVAQRYAKSVAHLGGPAARYASGCAAGASILAAAVEKNPGKIDAWYTADFVRHAALAIEAAMYAAIARGKCGSDARDNERKRQTHWIFSHIQWEEEANG